MDNSGFFFTKNNRSNIANSYCKAHVKILLCSRSTYVGGALRSDIYNLLSNLQNFSGYLILETTINDCFWRMEVVCESCDAKYPSFTILVFQRYFHVYLNVYCPHQSWKRREAPHGLMLETAKNLRETHFPHRHPFRVVGKNIFRMLSEILDNRERLFLLENSYSHGNHCKQRCANRIADLTHREGRTLS
jgi:hypothetical protein